MAYVLLQYAYFVVFMTFYVGQGDGRLKRTKDTLKHDLKLYKEMIGKINKDIAMFYEDYPIGPVVDYYTDDLRRIQDYRSNNKEKEIKDVNIKNTLKINEQYENDVSRSTPNKNIIDTTTDVTVSFHIQKYPWPKFEDILLAMGKKYDWKNDRWIKIRNKVMEGVTKEGGLFKSSFHEKHKFKYNIVKLNRTKSKRNIVIAVTAVR